MNILLYLPLSPLLFMVHNKHGRSIAAWILGCYVQVKSRIHIRIHAAT